MTFLRGGLDYTYDRIPAEHLNINYVAIPEIPAVAVSAHSWMVSWRGKGINNEVVAAVVDERHASFLTDYGTKRFRGRETVISPIAHGIGAVINTLMAVEKTFSQFEIVDVDFSKHQNGLNRHGGLLKRIDARTEQRITPEWVVREQREGQMIVDFYAFDQDGETVLEGTAVLAAYPAGQKQQTITSWKQGQLRELARERSEDIQPLDTSYSLDMEWNPIVEWNPIGVEMNLPSYPQWEQGHDVRRRDSVVTQALDETLMGWHGARSRMLRALVLLSNAASKFNSEWIMQGGRIIRLGEKTFGVGDRVLLTAKIIDEKYDPDRRKTTQTIQFVGRLAGTNELVFEGMTDEVAFDQKRPVHQQSSQGDVFFDDDPVSMQEGREMFVRRLFEIYNIDIDIVEALRRKDAAMKADKATIAYNKDNPLGGIDLSRQDAALSVTKDANGGVRVNVDPALIARIEREGLSEVVPVIINMKPTDIQSLFGV